MDHTLNAYFSAALTGVAPHIRRDLDETVVLVRELTERHGITLYFPGDHTDPVRDAEVPAEKVYALDREQVKAADLLFILAGTPSLGVGQELTMAHESLIPTVLLIPEGARVSRMTLGLPLQIEKVAYRGMADLLEILHQLMRHVLLPRIHARRASDGDLDGHCVGARIRRYRERAGMSHERLGAAVGITAAGVASLEAATDRQADPSLTQLRRIASELGVSANSLI